MAVLLQNYAHQARKRKFGTQSDSDALKIQLWRVVNCANSRQQGPRSQAILGWFQTSCVSAVLGNAQEQSFVWDGVFRPPITYGFGGCPCTVGATIGDPSKTIVRESSWSPHQGKPQYRTSSRDEKSFFVAMA